MATTLVEEEILVEEPARRERGGGGKPPDARPDDGGDGGRNPARRFTLYQTGVVVLLIPVFMLFLGLTSSMIVRKGVSDDWVPTQLPGILGLSTLMLALSSLTLEKARRALGAPAAVQMRPWLLRTTGLGLVFLVCQLIAWRQLAAQGVFLSSNPSSSFFYILTAAHGAHLIGGMGALLYLSWRSLGGEFGQRRRSALRAAAVYWHFMGILWIYVLFLLIFWR